MKQEVNNDNRVMLPPAMTAGRHDAACECGAVSMTCSFFICVVVEGAPCQMRMPRPLFFKSPI